MSALSKTQKEAYEDACIVRERLRNPKAWSIEVNREGGLDVWYWRLKCGPVCLMGNRYSPGFNATVAKDAASCGTTLAFWALPGDSSRQEPQEAVDDAVAWAGEYLVQLAATIEQAETAVTRPFQVAVTHANGCIEVYSIKAKTHWGARELADMKFRERYGVGWADMVVIEGETVVWQYDGDVTAES